MAATKVAKKNKKKKKKQARKKKVSKKKLTPKDKEKAAQKIVSQQEKAQVELARRELARRNLLAFVKRYESTYMAGWVHKVICTELMKFSEAVVRGESPRLMITVPPRHGKSMLASQYFPAWHLGNNPNHEFISTSYAQALQMDFSRKIQELIRSPDYSLLFDGLKIMKNNEAVERWGLADRTNRRTGGGLLAAGVGGPITGRGAHILLIDDPVKNRDEAESETVRETAKSWYSSTAYTRLAPGGGVLVIQCLAGDTAVTMADGSTKSLSAIRPGDLVATYERGQMTSAKVLNWANQGLDRVVAITTKSGRVVKANEKHPFLVDDNGELAWIRTKNLSPTQKIVSVRDSGENGRGKHAARKDVIKPSCAAGTVHRTTTRPSGDRVIAPRRLDPKHAAKRILSIATGLLMKITSACSLNKMANAPYASCPRRTPPPPAAGGESSASTTATIQRKSEGCYATTATLQSAPERPRECSRLQRLTCDFTTDEIVDISYVGTEDVFDIQVERTENFIAEGLVSSNTRWHDDDLSGWLLNEMRDAEREMKETGEWPEDADNWRVIDFPAIAVQDEKYRKVGDALHEERYPLKALLKIKRTLSPRDWAALYQQNPQVEEGAYFQKKYLRYYASNPPNYMDFYVAGDLAISKREHADFSVFIVAGLDQSGNIYMMEEFRGRWSSNEIIDVMFKIQRKYDPRIFALEKGHISLTMEDLLTRRKREENMHHLHVEEMLPGKQDKQLRARSFQGLMELGLIYWPEGALWVTEHTNELLRFPSGVKDDRVDADAWLGKILANRQYIGAGRPKKAKQSWKKKLAGYISGNRESNNPMAA